MHKSLASLLIFIFLSITVQSQDLKKQYIDLYKYTAVKNMLNHGIPASIILAQAIVESKAGKSELAQKANNHFGIKCHNTWEGKTFIMDDDTKDECFRNYKSVKKSYDDYALFLTNRDRYAFLFEYNITDYKRWAHGLKKAGYATNPEYAYLLIKIIEDYDLNRLDRIRDINEMGEDNDAIAQTQTVNDEIINSESQDFHPISISATNRLIYELNGVQYVLALKHDSWASIAQEFGFYTKQILDFNSANKKTDLNSGDRVYIERKNKKAEVMYHIVQEGETLRSISQHYAVRTNFIMRQNEITRNEELIAGQRLKLR